VQGLLVQRALAGDDQPGPRQRRGEPDQVEDELNSRLHGRAQDGHRGEPDPAGRASSRDPGQIQAGGPLDGVGPPGQSDIQLGHIRGRRPLLRTVHDRRPARSQ
jgi:hypothetical protein